MYEKGYSSWYSSLYSKRETAILAKVCKQYTFLAGDVTRMGRSKKRSIPHPQRKFPQSGEGGRDCLKNALNLFRMSRQGEGGYCQFPPWGGMDLFWNNPMLIWGGGVYSYIHVLPDGFLLNLS